jgi:hypothetical protein
MTEEIIKAPDGTEWRVGELVAVNDSYYGYKECRIVGVHYEGSWDPDARDVDSVYIMMDDGYVVRPRIMSKLPTSS